MFAEKMAANDFVATWLFNGHSFKFFCRQCIHSAMSRSFSNGKKILVNNTSMYYEQVGSGNHVVVLIPGALGQL